MTDLSPPQQAAFDTGLEHLGRQEAGLALPWLEEALQESLAQVESCRAGCEGPEEQEREAEEEEGTGSQGGLYEAIAGKGLECGGQGSQCGGAGGGISLAESPLCPPQGTGPVSCNAGSAVWGMWPRVLVAASLFRTSFPPS